MGVVARVCLDCGGDISGMHHANKRCEPCGKAWTLFRKRNWRNENLDASRAAESSYRKTHSDEIKARSTKYRKANSQKLNAKQADKRKLGMGNGCKSSKAWKQSNPEKVKAYYSQQVECLSKWYVASMLDIPVAQCPPELIQMKREAITIKRLSRDLKQSINQLKEPNETSTNPC